MTDLPYVAGDVVGSVQHSAPPPEVAYRPRALLTGEWRLFNHGLLFSRGGGADPEQDPVQQWRCMQPTLPRYIRSVWDMPPFDGIGGQMHAGVQDVPWDYVLCAVPEELGDSLFGYLAGLVLRAQSRRFVAALNWLDWSLTPNVGGNSTGVPLAVTAFGFTSLDATYGFSVCGGQCKVCVATPSASAVQFLRPLLDDELAPLVQRVDDGFRKLYGDET